MLQLRLQLIRCEPTSHFDVMGTHCNGNGILIDGRETFHLDPWATAEWMAFHNNVVPIIMRYWDRKFELTPSRPWYQPRHGEGAPVAARFTCSLSLALVDTAGHANQRYWIIKLRETTFRSFANAEERRGLFTHRDLMFRRRTRLTRMGTVDHNVSSLPEHDPARVRAYAGLASRRRKGQRRGELRDHAAPASRSHGPGSTTAAVSAARPWISQLRNHLIPARDEAPLTFTARIVSPQLITYWDNDWVPPAATAAGHAAP